MKESEANYIDNAATSSQNKSLIDDAVTREAIYLNVIKPLNRKIERMREEIKWLHALEAAGVDSWDGIEDAQELM